MAEWKNPLALFIAAFTVCSKMEQRPRGFEAPRAGLCLCRGRGGCSGRCWQALSKRCPTANPFRVQTPALLWRGICCRSCTLLWGSPALSRLLGHVCHPAGCLYVFFGCKGLAEHRGCVFLPPVSTGAERALCSRGGQRELGKLREMWWSQLAPELRGVWWRVLGTKESRRGLFEITSG